MTSNVMFLAELALFDGVAVAWGFWEFWSVRPKKKTNEPDTTPRKSAENAGHPEG